jgi:hypothetical protein
MIFEMLQREDMLRREMEAKVDQQAREMERMREEAASARAGGAKSAHLQRRLEAIHAACLDEGISSFYPLNSRLYGESL